MSHSAHIKMQLFNVRGWFAEDPLYAFFRYDYMTKHILGHAAHRTVRYGQLTEPLSTSKELPDRRRGLQPYVCTEVQTHGYHSSQINAKG